MRRQTLYSKLLLLFLGFGALMTAAFLTVMRASHETYHLEFDQTVNRDLAREYVAANLLIREPPLTAHNFARSLQRITEINPDIDVHVLDAGGGILASSVAVPPVVRKRIRLQPIVEFLSGRAKFPLLGDDPTDARRREVFSVAPLAIPDCPAAYLYVVLHRHDRAVGGHQLRTAYAINEGVGVLVIAVVLAVAGSLLFLRFLTGRLSVLKHDLEQFQASRFTDFPAIEASDDPAHGDEIERLRHLFVQLAERIRSQMRELQKTDELRREFFANVSHDLRTPLTTLHAHLETLSLKENLSTEERRTYFAVCVRQSQRLIKLTEQLLELAQLDAQQAPVTREPFQLAELAHDVAMKFELTAQRASVALTVEHAEEVPLVIGDIALLEHVFDNLLENALRYAPAGGAVTVRLRRMAHRVRVEVHDTGCGIPGSERDRVFERFYRGDKSRSSESGHAGLGLAIVRAIVELHGGRVDFVSAPNEGTTFFFELPIADGHRAAPGAQDTMPPRQGAAR